jgi:hypothetical protein
MANWEQRTYHKKGETIPLSHELSSNSAAEMRLWEAVGMRREPARGRFVGTTAALSAAFEEAEKSVATRRTR